MSDCSFKHELFSLFALLQSSEKINSEPKCQWVQAQVQYAGQYALLHQTTHLKCHKLRLFVNNLKKKCLWLCLFICSLISPSQPTPRRLPGLRASPAPPLWSSSHRLCTARPSASPRCIPSHQSVLECRWDAHLLAEMQITLSISLNQHELQSSLKQISNNRHHEHSQHVCLCSCAFIFLFCLWFISHACHHCFRHISFF